MNAIAFAEANEPEMALKLLGVSPKRKKRHSWDDIMIAITFAEAGAHDLAREYLGVKPDVRKVEDLAIPGVKIWFGSVALEPVAIPGVRVWYGTAAA